MRLLTTNTTRWLVVAGIGGEVRSVQKRETDDGDETRASQLARLGEVVEDVQAELLVAAIRQWRAGAPAIARRSSSTDAVAARVSF